MSSASASIGQAEAKPRLMIGGWVQPDPAGAPVEVRRAMVLVGSDGLEMGQVAAVVVAGAAQTATHLLLCRLTPDPDYRLVAVNSINQVDDAVVRLRIPGREAATLPRRQTD